MPNSMRMILFFGVLSMIGGANANNPVIIGLGVFISILAFVGTGAAWSDKLSERAYLEEIQEERKLW